jgi:hypothetical protein
MRRMLFALLLPLALLWGADGWAHAGASKAGQRHYAEVVRQYRLLLTIPKPPGTSQDRFGSAPETPDRRIDGRDVEEEWARGRNPLRYVTDPFLCGFACPGVWHESDGVSRHGSFLSPDSAETTCDFERSQLSSDVVERLVPEQERGVQCRFAGRLGAHAVEVVVLKNGAIQVMTASGRSATELLRFAPEQRRVS